MQILGKNSQDSYMKLSMTTHPKVLCFFWVASFLPASKHIQRVENNKSLLSIVTKPSLYNWMQSPYEELITRHEMVELLTDGAPVLSIADRWYSIIMIFIACLFSPTSLAVQ